MFTKLDHVGIVVKNIEEAIKLYCDILHLDSSGIQRISDGKVKLALLSIGDNAIELIEPITSEGRFVKHLREKGEGLFHINIFCEDYDAEVAKLKEKGYKPEEEVVTEIAPSLPPLRMAWLPPEGTKGVWVEVADVASIPPVLRGKN
jgi:methylmalonyl-CoA/ethylmalonyl-CoA epimerase